jgi:hypothetical protein
MKWRAWNWWKIGFFVMLLVFEVTREMYVRAADPYPGVPFNEVSQTSDGSVVTAEGQWEQVGVRGNDPLIPTAVTIQCWRDIGACMVATEDQVPGQAIMLPFVDRLPATFTPTAVQFTDDIPVCSTWVYRIDTVRRVTVGVGTSTHSPSPACRGTAERMEVRLIGWSNANFEEWEHRHFLPLIHGLGTVLRIFGTG